MMNFQLRTTCVFTLLHVFFFTFFFNEVHAQQLQQNNNYFDGVMYFEQMQYDLALPYFLKLQPKFSDNAEINYYLGVCHFNIPGKQENALPFLEKAVLQIDEKYSAIKLDNNGAPPIAWMALGDAYHREGDFTRASSAYHTYKSSLSGKDTESLNEVNRRIRGLGMSYEGARLAGNIEIVNLGAILNTSYSDYNPVLSGDQKTLVYTSYWKNRDKIFISSKDEFGAWQKPKEITSEIASQGNMYTTSISHDGTVLYLAEVSEMGADIYTSSLQKGRWTKKQALSGTVNSKYLETSACVSTDGKYLYFSSDRSGGEGGLDIYMAVNVNGEWKDVKNLGPRINSKFDEDAPFISQDGKVLYFSSAGHESIGKTDILYSTLNEQNEWAYPLNMGAPYNTVDDDVFFRQFEQTAYLARDMKGGVGKNDIYLIRILKQDSPIPEFTEEQEVALYEPDPLLDQKSEVETESSDAMYTQASEIETHTNNFEGEKKVEVAKSNATTMTGNFAGEFFTIQIMALTIYRDISTIAGIENIKVSSGSDGYYRYTAGEYSSIELAKKAIQSVWGLGYVNAYIRKSNSIDNY